MAMSVNRSPGATRQKRGEKHPAKFSARWLPAGIIWGPERFFFLILFFPFFLHGEQVGKLNPNVAADTTTQGRL